MTSSLKEQAVKAIQDRHEAENKAAENKMNSSSGAIDTIRQSQERVNKKKGKIPNVEIDKLQLYLGEPFKLNDKILILQPTVGELIRFG